MSERNHRNLEFMIGPMMSLLIVAAAVCLVTTLATWAFGSVLAAPLSVVAAAADATAGQKTEERTVIAPPATPTEAAEVPTGAPIAVATPEPADDAPMPTPTTALAQHIVQEGDTLGAIAHSYGVTVDALIAANALADPNRIYTGQVLNLPAGRLDDPIATATPLPPTPTPSPAPPSAVEEERWIDIDLTQQSLTAYEGGVPVRTTLVSTGLPQTPTPVGQFRIWIKLRTDDMAGPGYYIEDVPFVMYFHEGYGLHGVTWHGNFGHPMSHGCVNLPTVEAEWLFNWADVGTLVNLHEQSISSDRTNKERPPPLWVGAFRLNGC